MTAKTLVLLTDNYPDTAGEFFLDDEIKIINTHFKKIIVIHKKTTSELSKHYIPENLQLHVYNNKYGTYNYLKLLKYIFSNFFIREYIHSKKAFQLPFSILHLKIMIAELLQALQLKDEIYKTVQSQNIPFNDIIFYSYWNDYKALSLALIKNKKKNIVAISRAHGWDVDYKRHRFPYLPFKNLILSQLDKVYSISYYGQLCLSEIINEKFLSKITISKLGKTNLNKPQLSKTNNVFRICSCSNIIALKRIDLIVELLSKVNIPNMEWIHFGDGPLKNTIIELSKNKLANVKYQFAGTVTNSYIIQFYNDNYIDLFINMSETEGIPVSIMEAQSAAIPVLARNVGGISEIVNNDNGFLIEDINNLNKTIEIINNYFHSTTENQKAKRQKAYNCWHTKYNAQNNYTDFINSIISI